MGIDPYCSSERGGIWLCTNKTMLINAKRVQSFKHVIIEAKIELMQSRYRIRAHRNRTIRLHARYFVQYMAPGRLFSS